MKLARSTVTAAALIFAASACDSGSTVVAPTGPTISSIELVGTPTLVFDHLTNQQNSENVPDAQITAYKNASGTVNLLIPDSENYRMTGPSLHSLTMDTAEIFSSSAVSEKTTENLYNYDHWFTSPYTLDGTHIYTLAHTEWYACLLEGDCDSAPSGVDYRTNSWVTTINSLVSTNGGASWALNGVNSAHLVADFGYTWTGTPALTHQVYHLALNHTGMMTTSRIIQEGSYYYALGYVIHRDFSQLNLTTGQAPEDKEGFVIIRTTDVTNPAGWQAWVSGSTFTPVSSGNFNVFLPQQNGGDLGISLGQMVFDVKANVYIVVLAPWGTNGPIEYMTTPSLANPVWTDAAEVQGSGTFATDPRSAKAACNTGFSDSSYLSLLDDTSPGYNYEFSNGSLELFYVMNPAGCGGDNLARDVYRASLKVNY